MVGNLAAVIVEVDRRVLADRGRLFNDDNEDVLEKYGITERPAGERASPAISALSASDSLLAGFPNRWRDMVSTP